MKSRPVGVGLCGNLAKLIVAVRMKAEQVGDAVIERYSYAGRFSESRNPSSPLKQSTRLVTFPRLARRFLVIGSFVE
jgi:hypothetical protein